MGATTADPTTRSLRDACARSGVLLLVLLLGLSGLSQASPDPYAIFARAHRYWQQQRYPRTVTFVVAVMVDDGGTQKVNHYHLIYDSRENVSFVDAVSDEERASPHVIQHGCFNFSALGLPVGAPDTVTDLLGVPILAPNYNFGIAPYVAPSALTPAELVTKIRDEFHDPAPAPSAQPDALPLIGEVEAVHRNYHIEYVGREPYAQGFADHLSLRPLRDPRRYRLRDLWVDGNTGATIKLISDGNFVSGPSPGLQWTVTFKSVGGALYVQSEHATGHLHMARGANYRAATISFEKIVPGERDVFIKPLFKPMPREATLVEP